MSEEKESNNCCQSKNWRKAGGGDAGAGAVYGLGLIGAAIYFISTATTFWVGVLGVLKAIVWPAILVYEAFKLMLG